MHRDGRTRPVLATTVSRIDVLAAAPERLDEYGCQRAFAPAQAGEPSTFGILAIDGGAIAQGRAPGRGPAEVGRLSAPAARRAGTEKRSRSGRARKRSKSCATAESPACRSPIGITRHEWSGTHRDREDRATASARRDGHRLERTAGDRAPGVPRLLKPFMQGPLRETAKEGVPGLNARNGRRPPRSPEPGRRPSAFCRLFHFPRRAPRRACCCVCSSAPGLARYRRALPPVFPQRAAPDLSWTSSNCLFACGPPSIFRERQVHDFQGDCLFNLEQAPRRGRRASGARPSCAAARSSSARARSTEKPAGSAAAASRREGNRPGNLHPATTFCEYGAARLFCGHLCRVVKPRPEGQFE